MKADHLPLPWRLAYRPGFAGIEILPRDLKLPAEIGKLQAWCARSGKGGDRTRNFPNRWIFEVSLSQNERRAEDEEIQVSGANDNSEPNQDATPIELHRRN